MSSAITKAVHELETEHGPISKIPEAIMIEWRNEHRDLMIDGRNYNKNLFKLREDKRIKHLKEFNARIAAENDNNKSWLDDNIPANVVRGSKANAVRIYSTKLANAVQYINKLSNTKIAKKIGVKYDKVTSFVSRATRKKFYLLTTEGTLYEADTIVELHKKAMADGYVFSITDFNARIKRGGYINKGKKVIGKVSKQLIIKRVQVVNTDGNVIKEV